MQMFIPYYGPGSAVTDFQTAHSTSNTQKTVQKYKVNTHARTWKRSHLIVERPKPKSRLEIVVTLTWRRALYILFFLSLIVRDYWCSWLLSKRIVPWLFYIPLKLFSSIGLLTNFETIFTAFCVFFTWKQGCCGRRRGGGDKNTSEMFHCLS